MKAWTSSKVFHVRLNAVFPQTSLLNVWFMPWMAIWTRYQLNNCKWWFRCGWVQPKELRIKQGLSDDLTWSFVLDAITFSLHFVTLYNVMTGKEWIYVCVRVCVCVCVCVGVCVKKLNTKYQGLPLVQNLLLHILPFLWTKEKLISLISKSLSLWYGFDILMMFSLFGYMVKKTVRVLKKILITTTPALNLPTSSIKKAFPFWTLRWACLGVNWPQTCTLSLQINISTCTMHLLIQTIPNVPLFLVKLWGLAGYAAIKQILKDIWTIWNHGSKQEAILNI